MLLGFQQSLQLHIYMKQISKGQPPKSKTLKLYFICRSFITIALTIAVMIPFIYLIGSDESFYSQKPLYEAYAKNAYFQAKVLEVESALNSSLIVNIYSQQAHEKKQSAEKQWQHLREFVSYLGYSFNQKGLNTVDRLITPPEIKQQKKGKGTQNVDNQKQLEKAYSLGNIGEMHTLRNKINKAAVGIFDRLKIKANKVPKNSNIGEGIKSKIVGQVLGNKVWFITIHPDYWQYHSAQELRKQLTVLSKQREKDRFVVISIGPADAEWKKMKNISINLGESVISSMKSSFKDIISNYFSFEINATRVIQTILCQSETSLFQLNNFLHRCNTSFSCYNTIKLFRKEKSRKGETNQVKSYADQLCEVGQISQDDSDFTKILKDLGFITIADQSNEDVQNTVKMYYEIANGKKCKGNKRCNYEWLQASKPIKPVSKEAQQQLKPIIKQNKSQEAKPEIKPAKPVKVKTPEKKPPVKPKKHEQKASNKTKSKPIEANKTSKNPSAKQAIKEQRPSKNQSSKDAKQKTNKPQNKSKSSEKDKKEVKKEQEKVPKMKDNKPAKDSSKIKKDKSPKNKKAKEIIADKNTETSNDTKVEQIEVVATQLNNEENPQIIQKEETNEAPLEADENSAKEEENAVPTPIIQEAAAITRQIQQQTNAVPQESHFDVAQIPCDNENNNLCPSSPAEDTEKAIQSQVESAAPAEESQNKQVAKQTIVITQENSPVEQNPPKQAEVQQANEEVTEEKKQVVQIEEVTPLMTKETGGVTAEIISENPESTQDNAKEIDQTPAQIEQNSQKAAPESPEIAQAPLTANDQTQ